MYCGHFAIQILRFAGIFNLPTNSYAYSTVWWYTTDIKGELQNCDGIFIL